MKQATNSILRIERRIPGKKLVTFSMTPDQLMLWEKINRFELDDPLSSYSFSDRLARENNWSLDYALEVITEYKKFIFLQCIAAHPLTPSDQVDQAWHLHLLYTRSYWIDLCENTLGRQIHHGPTKGGNAERNKFGNWYEKTLELYCVTFGQQPPISIWPPSEKRFRDIHFSRVNTKWNWVIAKPKFLQK
jgi:hypothetical protein